MGGEEHKTPGDIAGESAKAKNADRAGKPDEPAKMPTLTQEKVDRLMKDWTKYLQPGHLMVFREFLERNFGVVLEVTDKMDPLRSGVVVFSRDGAGIRVGNSIYTIFGHSNEDRFRLTEESAKKMCEYLMRRDLETVTEDTRRSYMNAWMPETTGKGKSKEEIRLEVVDGVLKIMRGTHNFSYATRVKGKRDGIVSMTYKCERGEGMDLIERARKCGIAMCDGTGGYEFRIENAQDENEWVEAIKSRGYKKQKCLPARVKINLDGKFISFFPDIDVMDAVEKS